MLYKFKVLLISPVVLPLLYYIGRLFPSRVMDSYGENEKEEKEQQELAQEGNPLFFVYFTVFSITERAFPDISSKPRLCVSQFFLVYTLASHPPAHSISPAFLGKWVEFGKTGSCRRRGSCGLPLSVRLRGQDVQSVQLGGRGRGVGLPSSPKSLVGMPLRSWGLASGGGLLTVIYNASRGLVMALPGVTQIILKCFGT